jgi:hypothetical protein
MRRLAVALVGWAFVAGGCATYQDELARGQRAFEQSEHDRALAIFRGLEPSANALSVVDRAHYAYLRGMTDYRIGYRADARHWLAMAAVMDERTPGSLPPEWAAKAAESLHALNEEVYAGGIEALSRPAPPNGTAPGGADVNPALDVDASAGPNDAPEAGE